MSLNEARLRSRGAWLRGSEFREETIPARCPWPQRLVLEGDKVEVKRPCLEF